MPVAYFASDSTTRVQFCNQNYANKTCQVWHHTPIGILFARYHHNQTCFTISCLFYIVELHAHSSTSSISIYLKYRQLFWKHSYSIHSTWCYHIAVGNSRSQNCYKGFTVLCTPHTNSMKTWSKYRADTATPPISIQTFPEQQNTPPQIPTSFCNRCTFYRKGTFCTTFIEIYMPYKSGLCRAWTAPFLVQHKHYFKTPQKPCVQTVAPYSSHNI